MRTTLIIPITSLAIGITIPAAEPGTRKPDVKERSTVGAQAEKKSATQLRAEKIVIPKLDFRESTVRAALQFLALKSRQLDPDGKGINIILAPPKPVKAKADASPAPAGIPGIPAADDVAPRIPATEPPLVVETIEGPPVTLLLKDVSVAEAIMQIAKVADIGVRWDEHTAYLRMSADKPGKQNAAKSKPPAPRPPVKNNIGKFGEALLARYAKHPVIPRVDFHEAKVNEAVQFLLQRHRELDPEGGSVNWILGADSTNEASVLWSVSLSAIDIPVFEALRYVAEITGFDVSLGANEENGAVVIALVPPKPAKKR